MLLAFIVIFTGTVFSRSAFSSETPSVEAQGAILMDFKTGRVLWEKNARTPLAMASTTKIMTALIALEKSNLNDTVKVSRQASITPPVKMFLQRDEEIKLEYLLYALMMQSSNDAAVAIAEHIGGTVEEFCAMMTDRAAQMGCENTVFQTPNGLDGDNHHSTAYDMAIITREALSNKEFVRIINTPTVTFTSSKSTYDVMNKNRLLNEFSGATGVKTGYTGKAGHCFVGSAERDGMQLISVVLASGWGSKGKEQKWVDTKEILGFGFADYSYENIIEANNHVGTVKIERSKTPEINIYVEEGLILPLSETEKSQINIDIDAPELLRAPVAENQRLGTARIYISDELVKEIAVLSEGYAERHDLKTSLEKVLQEFIQMGTTSDVEVVLPEF